MSRVHLSAGTHAERRAVTTRVLDALGRVGVVEDARQHSNKEVAIRFATAPGRVGALRQELADLPLRLSEASSAELLSLSEHEEASGWLVITFVHGDPDLRIAQPVVPG